MTKLQSSCEPLQNNPQNYIPSLAINEALSQIAGLDSSITIYLYYDQSHTGLKLYLDGVLKATAEKNDDYKMPLNAVDIKLLMDAARSENIVTLSMQHNKLGDDSLKALLDNLPLTLRELDLTDNEFTVEGRHMLEGFVKAHPAIKITAKNAIKLEGGIWGYGDFIFEPSVESTEEYSNCASASSSGCDNISASSSSSASSAAASASGAAYEEASASSSAGGDYMSGSSASSVAAAPAADEDQARASYGDIPPPPEPVAAAWGEAEAGGNQGPPLLGEQAPEGPMMGSYAEGDNY